MHKRHGPFQRETVTNKDDLVDDDTLGDEAPNAKGKLHCQVDFMHEARLGWEGGWPLSTGRILAAAVPQFSSCPGYLLLA